MHRYPDISRPFGSDALRGPLERRVVAHDSTKEGFRLLNAAGFQTLIGPIGSGLGHVGSESLLRLGARLKALQNDRIRTESLMPPNVLIPLGQAGHTNEEVIDLHRKLLIPDPRHRDRLKLEFDDDPEPPNRHVRRAPLFRRAA